MGSFPGGESNFLALKKSKKKHNMDEEVEEELSRRQE